jgi:predicted nicotinamide N-methyase
MLPHRFQRPASTRTRKTPSRRPLYFFNGLLAVACVGDTMTESSLPPVSPFPSPMPQPLFRDLDLDGSTFRQLNLDHPQVEARILTEMSTGVKVYYDREWPFTRSFCRFLLAHPGFLARRRVLVAGAGLGMEAVVAGRLAERLWVNDLAPAALELQQLQLQENGVVGVESLGGSFGELELPPAADLVMGCFVVYDRETAAAMESLLRHTYDRGVPALLADLDIGGHFSRILDRCDAPVRDIAAGTDVLSGGAPIRVVQVG